MRWIFLLVLTLQAATCGQKGPLTLPDESRSLTPAAQAQTGAESSHILPTS